MERMISEKFESLLIVDKILNIINKYDLTDPMAKTSMVMLFENYIKATDLQLLNNQFNIPFTNNVTVVEIGEDSKRIVDFCIKCEILAYAKLLIENRRFVYQKQIYEKLCADSFKEAVSKCSIQALNVNRAMHLPDWIEYKMKGGLNGTDKDDRGCAYSEQ